MRTSKDTLRSISKRGFVTAYAVIRVDETDNQLPEVQERFGVIAPGPSHVKVKEIVLSAEEARNEVARLNSLNASNGCRYYWQSTHLYGDLGSDGRRVSNT